MGCGALYFGGGPGVRWSKSSPHSLCRRPSRTSRIRCSSSKDQRRLLLGKGTGKSSRYRTYERKYEMGHPAPFWRVSATVAFRWRDFTKEATRWRSRAEALRPLRRHSGNSPPHPAQLGPRLGRASMPLKPRLRRSSPGSCRRRRSRVVKPVGLATESSSSFAILDPIGSSWELSVGL